MNRKQFLQTTTLGVGTLTAGTPTAGPVAAPLAGSGPTPILNPITPVAVKQVRASARFFQLWTTGYGSAANDELAKNALRAELRLATGLLQASGPAPLRAQLRSAVDDLLKIAAIMDVNVDDALAEPTAGPTSP